MKTNGIALLAAIATFSLGATEASAATFNVTKTTDFIPTSSSDPNYVGTLRWAIEQAENNPGADTININVGGATINVNNQDPNIPEIGQSCSDSVTRYTPAAAFQITQSLTINGNGAIIDGGRTGNAGSLNGRRIFYVPNNSSGNINLNNLTLQNGNGAVIKSDGGREHIANGGGDGHPCSNGGVIWMEDATINLNKVRVSGGLSNDGGAINIQSGTLTVNDSTFDGNLARDDGGVFDIDNLGTVSMLNSTMTRNESGINPNPLENNGGLGGTGGIARVEGNFSLTYVTAAYNVAGGRGAFDIRSSSDFVLRNNLFIENTLASDNTVKHCAPDDDVNIETDITVQDNNWADTNDCGTKINVDTAANIQLSNSLAPNGGDTPTLALLNTSSVNGIIETTDSLCPGGVGADDQRDVARGVNAGCEPGAYELQFPVTTDYGDAPDTYGDASHNISASPSLYLGNVAPDSETDTQLGTDAGVASAGDDNDGNDDEDAFVVLPNVPFVDPSLSDLSLGRNYNLNVPVTNNTGGDATLHAWIDFNQNGKFEAEEYQSATVNNNANSANLSWDIPLTTIIGDTHARFRLTSDELTDKTGLLDPLIPIDVDDRSVGNAANGEVEDYPVSIAVPLYDYGDAPDTGTGTGTGNYQTTESDDGPTHIVIKDPLDLLHLSLGENIDGDDGSLQNDNANADDVDTTNVDILGTLLDNGNTNLNDEDGVSSFPVLTTTPGQTYTVPVTVRNNIPLLNAFLVGYIDFNRDGDFDDPGEKSATVTVPSDLLTISPGSITLDTTGDPRTFNVTFTVPAGVTPGDTYARFRLGSIKEIVESATGVTVSTDNGEVNNGEVEDYKIAIAPSPISPFAGQLIINEVLYAQTGANSAADNDEFIELFNASSNSIDLGGFQLIDGNLLVSVTDDPAALDGSTGSITGSQSPYVFPAGTILQPGEYAVIWIGDRTSAAGTQIPERFAAGATFQDWLGSRPSLNNTGDDVWLYDADTKVIDYIVYGRNTSTSQAINTRPDPSLNLWDSTYENQLDGAPQGQSISLTPNGQDGNTSACWEKTAIATTNADSASGRCTGFLETRDTDPAVVDTNQRITSVGENNNGTTSNTPELVLVKRITAINPGQPNYERRFDTFVDDPDTTNDNEANWPSDVDTYLPGEIEVIDVKPGDEVEYTIYFLSNGDIEAKSVQICDVIPDNMTYVKDAYGVEVGMALGLDSVTLPTVPNKNLSNVIDKDEGNFYGASTNPPADLCKKVSGNSLVTVDGANNDNGAVVVNLDSLPAATSPGDPVGSYGFIRFRARVK